MSSFKKAFKNHPASGKNKPDVEGVQDLLMGTPLLVFAFLFIDAIPQQYVESPSKTTFKLLLRPTYLSTWLSYVTMLFLSLFNKYKACFLLPKTLSVARDDLS